MFIYNQTQFFKQRFLDFSYSADSYDVFLPIDAKTSISPKSAVLVLATWGQQKQVVEGSNVKTIYTIWSNIIVHLSLSIEQLIN